MDIFLLVTGLLIGFILGDRQLWRRKAMRTEEWLAEATSFMICSKEFAVSVRRIEDGEEHSAIFSRKIIAKDGDPPRREKAQATLFG